MISCHSFVTALTLVKKRWPPMSMRQSPKRAVREMPPTTSSASSTTLVRPCLANSYAAVSPAGPAPMITCRGSASSLGSVLSAALPAVSV